MMAAHLKLCTADTFSDLFKQSFLNLLKFDRPDYIQYLFYFTQKHHLNQTIVNLSSN